VSLHRTEIHYRGLRIWIESESASDPYKESDIMHCLNRDFAQMLRAVGADVRVHFQSTAKTTYPATDRLKKRQTALESNT